MKGWFIEDLGLLSLRSFLGERGKIRWNRLRFVQVGT